MTINTQVAHTAIRQGVVPPAMAEACERAAARIKEHDSLIPTDAAERDTFVQNATVQTLPRPLVLAIFHELRGDAAAAFEQLARSNVPKAFHDISNLLGEWKSAATVHGPDFKPLNDAAFDLDANPQYVLRHATHAAGELNGSPPHVLVTIATEKLYETRTYFELSRDEVTPQAFAEAMRKVMNGAHAHVEIRVCDQNGVMFISPALVETPPAR